MEAGLQLIAGFAGSLCSGNLEALIATLGDEDEPDEVVPSQPAKLLQSVYSRRHTATILRIIL